MVIRFAPQVVLGRHSTLPRLGRGRVNGSLYLYANGTQCALGIVGQDVHIMGQDCCVRVGATEWVVLYRVRLWSGPMFVLPLRNYTWFTVDPFQFICGVRVLGFGPFYRTFVCAFFRFDTMFFCGIFSIPVRVLPGVHGLINSYNRNVWVQELIFGVGTVGAFFICHGSRRSTIGPQDKDRFSTRLSYGLSNIRNFGVRKNRCLCSRRNLRVFSSFRGDLFGFVRNFGCNI